MKRKALWLGWVTLLLAAIAVRAVNLDWGLPEVHEEATPVREAVEFWGVPGSGLDLDPHFFKYPSFTFYLNFIAQGIWYFWLSLTGQVESLNAFRQLLAQDLAQPVLLGRWLQVLLGALVVVPTVLLGRRIAGDVAGWCAGLLVCLLPALVTQSQVVGPDTALTLFATAALVSAAAITEQGRRADYLWTGLWIGLATASKYPGALLLFALLAAHATHVHRDRQGPGALLLSGYLAQALLVAAVAFVAATPYVILDLGTALEDIDFERRHMALGHLGREGGRAWGYYLTGALPAGWTWPVVAVSLFGLVWLIAVKRSRAVIPGLVFALITLGILGSWRMAAARYILPLAPIGAVWAGSLLAGVPGGVNLSGRSAPVISGTLTLLLVLWPSLVTLRDLSGKGRPDSRVAAGEWLNRELPEGSSVLLERYGPELDPDRFIVLNLPFHAVKPHLYDPAYVPRLYRTFDYVVLSSGVHSRYLARPREYPQQVLFYRSLDLNLEEVAVFSPGRYLGPEIRVLRRLPESWPPGVGMPASFFNQYRGNGPLAEYFSTLGAILVRQGYEQAGFSMMEGAVDMAPENAKTWGNLGASRLRVGRSEEALAALREARDLDPEDPHVWINLALLYARMKEAGQAADAYRRAIEIAPDREDAFLGLARALVEDDRYAEARVVLREFLHRFPRSPRRPDAEQALDQLSRMGPGRP